MRDPRYPTHPDQPRAAGVFVGKVAGIVLAVVGLWAWSAGQLAGLVFGQAWLPIGPADMVRILARLPGTLGDPAAAWPVAAQPELPGPVGMYLSAAVLAGLAVWLGALALAWWDRRHGRSRWWRPRRQRHLRGEGASWAGRWDLRGLVTRDPRPGRVTLGRLGRGGRLLAAEPGASALVIGPAGSRKTVGVANPVLLDWAGPAVATSVKLDQLRATVAGRARRGQILIVDPTGLSGLPSVGWSPIAACTSWRGAQATARRIAETDQQMAGGRASGDHVFWVRQAQKLLGVLLYAAGSQGLGMVEVLRWVNLRDSTPAQFDVHGDPVGPVEVAKLLEGLDHPQATEEWLAITHHTPKALDSVYVTAEDLLAVYADERVAAFTRTSELDWAAFLAGEHTLYLYGPLHEQRRLRPLFEVLLAELVEYAQEHAARQPDGELPRKLLLDLDEAANLAALSMLPELSATARGVGIHLVTVWQDWAQLQARYGPEQARTVFNNHLAKLLLPGIGDAELLKLASELVGERAYTETTLGWDPGTGRQHYNQTSVSYRPLLTVDALRRLPRDTAVLIYGNRKPARVRLRPCYTRTQQYHRARSEARLARRARRDARWKAAYATQRGRLRPGHHPPRPPALAPARVSGELVAPTVRFPGQGGERP